jgi:hypothetical protein
MSEVFTNVIVGVDGNEGDRYATALARLLCDEDRALHGVWRGSAGG